jgi:hypothetical protein
MGRVEYTAQVSLFQTSFSNSLSNEKVLRFANGKDGLQM